MFGYGLCTYANEAKEKLLGVSKESLNNFGAVSHQVASEMSMGLLKLSCADVAVCTTGIASPVISPSNKPLGLVYVGVASKLKASDFLVVELNRNISSLTEENEALLEKYKGRV